jgi:hypothetical protein
MTNAQLKDLLRWAVRYVGRENRMLRDCHMNPRTRRIEPSSAALEVAKADMWLAKARKATARRKAVKR